MILRLLSGLTLRIYRVLRKLDASSTSLEFISPSSHNFNIVITTFDKRFESYAVPLIEQIRMVTLAPITLIINGNYTGPANSVQLEGFLTKVLKLKNIFPVTYQEFHGCARMWNDGIYYSQSENVLILNDDLTILPERFVSDVNFALSNLEKDSILVFNKSWSHFLVNRRAILEYGWFDERYIAIGNEDGEYADRFTKLTGEYIPTLHVDCFINISDPSTDIHVQPAEKKYSLFNKTLHEMVQSGAKLPSADVHPYWNWYKDCKGGLLEEDPAVIREIVKIAADND